MSRDNVSVEFCCKAKQRNGLVREEGLKEDVLLFFLTVVVLVLMRGAATY